MRRLRRRAALTALATDRTGLHPHRPSTVEPTDAPLAGAVPSPNIWGSPEVYEAENRGVDPAGVIDAAIRQRLGPAGWAGLRVAEVGCGTGFHLARYVTPGDGPDAGAAAHVVGVEPHPDLARRARARVADLELGARVEVLAGTAQSLPLPDASLDVAVARWAYFFGPGCEAGLVEVARVLAPGGTFLVVDHDATRSTFGGWFTRAWPAYDAVAVERFWGRRGFQQTSLDVRWAFGDRATFDAVIRLELPPRVADAALAQHDGTGVDAAVALRWRRQR